MLLTSQGFIGCLLYARIWACALGAQQQGAVLMDLTTLWPLLFARMDFNSIANDLC